MGIDASAFVSKATTLELLVKADLILVMEEYMKAILVQQYFKTPTSHIMTFADAAGESGDVEDRFGGDMPKYRESLDQIKYYARKIVHLWEQTAVQNSGPTMSQTP